MFITRMISFIYNFLKKFISACYHFIINLPNWYKAKINFSKTYIKDFRYRLNNLSTTNLDLGIYHLNKLQINDAILRFKLVTKFLDKENKVAHYWLGWCYFLKDNYEQASSHLAQAGNVDEILLKDFVKNHSRLDNVPVAIWQQYRDFVAEHYTHNFYSDDIHLPYRFIQKVLYHIKELPNQYNILELGSNIGLAGYEIRKRFPDSFILKGVEISERMIELSNTYYQKIKIYDMLIQDDLQEVINHTSETFDVILSLCGFSYTKDLSDCFDSIATKLNNQGYLAFCLPINNTTIYSTKRKEFIFAVLDIENAIDKKKFNILDISEIILKENNKYAIFVCQKIA
ncbi:methyltransferase [Candidatus Trichorickettsia mobilis]|uniref:methyltransferase n=1 Tax=Candidatus Trichorickettsia mobilis TaxID=1346319 RepID=UPI00292D017C|nr:methyltransferase [Candidatus Trichorickettsia mobilis]